MIDIVLINPGDRKQIFQDLGNDFSAVEPPFWAAVLAAYLRQQNFSVAIVDANAGGLSPEQTAQRALALDPVLCAVIVYGAQPSASTQNMTAAGCICQALKSAGAQAVAIGGLHPSALPEQTLRAESVDFVVDGEGPLTFERLIPLLRSGQSGFKDVPGLWWRNAGNVINHTPRAPLIDNLDRYLPVAAWDLLPMHLYRAHNWHCFDNLQERSPYAAIYTSLGCPFSCVFCCINAPFGKPGIRFRSPNLVLKELDLLANTYNVHNVKIVDELFILDERHYMEIINGLLLRDYRLNIWAYARVDTIRLQHLSKMKKAGINWLALGIESADPNVRDQARKTLRNQDIKNVVKAIQDEGIRVIGNFIFGLPEDNMDSMRATLNLALELNCEFVNFYCAMAYPGSKLYDIAVKSGWSLPGQWHGYSQHAYDTLPLPTSHLTARQVLEFRDNAFHKYFTSPNYLNMLEAKFGRAVRDHVAVMTRTRLKRKLPGA